MKFHEAEKYVTGLLQNKLSSGLYYHSYSHTLDVIKAAEELAHDEKIKDANDVMLLKTAALFHDCGFINVYQHHEEEGCRLAKENLPRFGYSEIEIEIICNLIMKTKSTAQPQTHLEKILCDADLDYLGRDDFEVIGNKLFKELLEKGKVKNENEWNELQIKFLEAHHYHTASAIAKRENKKQEHLLKLKNSQLKNVN